eukprot:GHVS01062087.1.p1 GENE.GHVS01062087.1~~GHVS01062087.1.p1  ORF type:complete len:723 (+),score=73.38 GHVS01062087.1:136-2304(+)
MQLLSSKKPTLGISFCLISCLLLAAVSYVLLWSAFPSKLTEVWGLDNKGYHRHLMPLPEKPQESISLSSRSSSSSSSSIGWSNNPVSSNNDGSRGDQEKSVDPTVLFEGALPHLNLDDLDFDDDQPAGHQGGGSEQGNFALDELVTTLQPQPVQPQSVPPQSFQPLSVPPQSFLLQPVPLQSVPPQSFQTQTVQPQLFLLQPVPLQSVQQQSLQPSILPQPVQPQLFQPPAGQPAGQTAGQPAGQTAGQPAGQTAGQGKTGSGSTPGKRSSEGRVVVGSLAKVSRLDQSHNSAHRVASIKSASSNHLTIVRNEVLNGATLTRHFPGKERHGCSVDLIYDVANYAPGTKQPPIPTERKKWNKYTVSLVAPGRYVIPGEGVIKRMAAEITMSAEHLRDLMHVGIRYGSVNKTAKPKRLFYMDATHPTGIHKWQMSDKICYMSDLMSKLNASDVKVTVTTTNSKIQVFDEVLMKESKLLRVGAAHYLSADVTIVGSIVGDLPLGSACVCDLKDGEKDGKRTCAASSVRVVLLHDPIEVSNQFDEGDVECSLWTLAGETTVDANSSGEAEKVEPTGENPVFSKTDDVCYFQVESPKISAACSTDNVNKKGWIEYSTLEGKTYLDPSATVNFVGEGVSVWSNTRFSGWWIRHSTTRTCLAFFRRIAFQGIKAPKIAFKDAVQLCPELIVTGLTAALLHRKKGQLIHYPVECDFLPSCHADVSKLVIF